jgi:hypothetical protein
VSRGKPEVSAELAARRTAAAAALADYTHAAATADVAGRALWAARLAGILEYVLSGLDGQDDAGAAIEAEADAAWLRERAAETLQLRGRVADLADELDREAAVITPSKAAEIKRGTAERIRAALEAGQVSGASHTLTAVPDSRRGES